MMRPCFFLAAICTILTSCHSSDATLKATIENSDSVVINYFDGTVADSVTAVAIIRDPKTIALLTDYITRDTIALPGSITYNGSIHFFKQDNVVQDIYFERGGRFGYFIYKENGRTNATMLTYEVEPLLDTLHRR